MVRRPASQAPSLVAGALALFSLSGCEKLALRENVYTGTQERPTPPTATPDASVGVPFVPDAGFPSSDAGTSICGAGPAVDTAFSKVALLESAAQCARLQYCEFEQVAATFAERAAAYGEAPSPEALELAKAAWFFAIQRWQVAELFRFGPAAPTMEPGGQGLREEIYAFPNTNRCKVDEQLVAKTYATDNFGSSIVTARGLGSAEYLLFSASPENSCSQFSSINGSGSWAALTVEELHARRAAYVGAIGPDIRATARELSDAWAPNTGNFTRQLVQAGKGSDVYASVQEALNAVSNALWYVDKELKDSKLANPAGLGECEEGCVNTVESPFALNSAQHIRNNLAGFRLLFQGCGPDNAGLGFDDWLRTAGQGALADKMLKALDEAEGAAAEIAQESLEYYLVNDIAKVRALYDKVKVLTDLLKSDFITVLNLEKPMSAASDND